MGLIESAMSRRICSFGQSLDILMKCNELHALLRMVTVNNNALLMTWLVARTVGANRNPLFKILLSRWSHLDDTYDTHEKQYYKGERRFIAPGYVLKMGTMFSSKQMRSFLISYESTTRKQTILLIIWRVWRRHRPLQHLQQRVRALQDLQWTIWAWTRLSSRNSASDVMYAWRYEIKLGSLFNSNIADSWQASKDRPWNYNDNNH